jgi:hypothetical protein
VYIGIQRDYKSTFVVGLGREKNMHQDELLGLID